MKAAVLMLLPLLPCTVLAKPGIDWLSVHWPPFRIAEGAQKGQGHVDQMQQLLMAELPQYEHRVHYSNLARVEQTLASPKTQTCIFSLFYNETRGKTLHYSIPAVVSVNVTLHVRADHPLAKQWQLNPDVGLAEVTAAADISGVVEQNRGYPAEVMQYLDVPGSNLTSQSLQNVNPVDFLTAKRFDYLIEFPDRVRYFQSLTTQKSQIVDLPIRGSDPLMVSYVACQASAEGAGRLRDINVALQKLRRTSSYQKLMVQWLSPHRQRQLQQVIPQFVDDVKSPKPEQN